MITKLTGGLIIIGVTVWIIAIIIGRYQTKTNNQKTEEESE